MHLIADGKTQDAYVRFRHVPPPALFPETKKPAGARLGAFALPGAALAAMALLWTPHAAIAQTAPIAITVDGTAAGTALKPVWSYYGYDEVNYTTTPEGKQLLKDVKAANSDPVYIRTHFLLNTKDGANGLKWGSTNVYSEDAQGKPVYDWTVMDSIMDQVTSAGTLPFVEIAFMPKALSSQPSPYRISGTYNLDGGGFFPPKDYEKWSELIRAWAEHSKSRYPGVEDSWLWQLWNEPDIGYWHGTHAEFFKLYDYTERALHGVLPKALLGGPEVTSGSAGMLKEFLTHCATGTNAASGQTGTRLDMVTFHAKGGVAMSAGHIQMNLGNQLRIHRNGFAAVAGYSQFRDTPIVIGEADPDGCAACPASQVPADGYRNVPAYGAYEAAMMKHSLDLADSLKVNLMGLVTWAWTFPGSPYFSGFRELANNGIHKPVMNVFKMLGKLQGQRLPLKSAGARGLAGILTNGVRGAADIDGLAAKDANRVVSLIWNYHDDLVTVAPAEVRLTVTLPAAFPAEVRVTHYRMDSTHSNAYTAWLKMGSPQSPTAAQLTQLKTAMALETLAPTATMTAVNGKVTVDFALPRHGVSLIVIENPQTTGIRAAPAWPPAKVAGQTLSIRGSGPHDIQLTDFRGSRITAFRGQGAATYSLRGLGKGLCLAHIRTSQGVETRRILLF